MPETQAEVIAGRFARQLEGAGWDVEVRVVPETGSDGETPSRITCWVKATRDPAQLATFGWASGTGLAPHTTHYLGGSLSRPGERIRADRQVNLRTLTTLRQFVRMEQILAGQLRP